jgi:hypothetical protein
MQLMIVVVHVLHLTTAMKNMEMIGGAI